MYNAIKLAFFSHLRVFFLFCTSLALYIYLMKNGLVQWWSGCSYYQL